MKPRLSLVVEDRVLHELQQQLIDVALKIFDHTNGQAFFVRLPGPSPELYVIAGSSEDVARLNALPAAPDVSS